MGRSNMTSLKITLLPLAICLLLSLNSKVTGKPSPKHFLIETKEKTKKNNDYTDNVHNIGGKICGIGDGSVNFCDYTGNVQNVGGKIGGIGDGSVNSGDYTGNVNNVGGKIGGIGDRSVNFGRDYMGIGTLNNAAGGSVSENNNHYYNHHWGKK